MAFGEFLIEYGYEPKQNFRFIVQMGQPTRIMFEAKTVSKPKLKFSTVQLNNADGTTINFPASPEWDPVTIKFMAGGNDAMFQTENTDVSRGIVEMLAAAGYDKFGERQYKGNSVDAFNEILIRQLNREGGMIEEWSLINPYFENIDFGSLDYSSNELSDITVTIRYDHAVVKFADGSELVRSPTKFIGIAAPEA